MVGHTRINVRVCVLVACRSEVLQSQVEERKALQIVINDLRIANKLKFRTVVARMSICDLWQACVWHATSGT